MLVYNICIAFAMLFIVNDILFCACMFDCYPSLPYAILYLCIDICTEILIDTMCMGVKEKWKGAMFYENQNAGIISKWS